MNDIDRNKIIRYLSGEATPQEAGEVLEWKNSDDKNREFFKETEIVFNTSQIVINPEKYSSTKAYANLEKKLSPKIRSINISRFLGYAATALVAIVLTWFIQLYFHGRDTVPEQLADETYTQSVETPEGARSLITLEDGTKIWLNANSRLTYPTHFDRNQRTVHLEGEGFFDVAKDKTWPFKVETSDLSINVLGTVFNVKSYPEEGLIETTLIEGKIVLNKITDNDEQEILILKPKQKATFIKKEGVLFKDDIYAANIPEAEKLRRTKEKLVISKDVDEQPVIAWKDNKMIFKNETFESIAVSLERRYGVSIKFESEGVKEYRFSGIFDEISIDQALQALQFASPFKYRIEQKFIIIKK